MYKDKNKGKKSSLLYQTYTPSVFQKSSGSSMALNTTSEWASD